MVGFRGRVHVVVAHHIAHRQAAGSNRPGGRNRYRPRAVVARGQRLHRGQNALSLVDIRRALFVPHGPHKHAGMIAVAADKIFKLPQSLGIRRHHARLVKHQHAQLVAGVQQLRRGRIVRGPQRIAAHLLQLADPVVLHRVGQRSAHAGVVLVVAGAFHFHRASVQQESLLRVELHRANAERGPVAVHRLAAHPHLGHQRVQVSLLQRPQQRLVQSHLLRAGLLPSGCGNKHRSRDRLAHLFAGGVQHRGHDACILRRQAVVIQFRADAESRGAGPYLRFDKSPPLLHVHRVVLHQPHMAIDARSLVKPAVARRGVHAHQQHISAVGIGKVRHVEAERIVTPAVTPDVKTVEDDHRLPVRAVKLQ